jgi:hypothetical protein
MYAKGLYAAALGIEILCIAAAEIGENTGLYLFGFNPGGIAIAYAMGYALAGLTTFITILGRYDYNHRNEKGTGTHEIDSCCSVLKQDSTVGFLSNVKRVLQAQSAIYTNTVVEMNRTGYPMIKSHLLSNLLP